MGNCDTHFSRNIVACESRLFSRWLCYFHWICPRYVSQTVWRIKLMSLCETLPGTLSYQATCWKTTAGMMTWSMWLGLSSAWLFFWHFRWNALWHETWLKIYFSQLNNLRLRAGILELHFWLSYCATLSPFLLTAWELFWNWMYVDFT